MPVRRFLLLCLAAGAATLTSCRPEPSVPDNTFEVLPVDTMTVFRSDSYTFDSTYYGRIEPARRAALSFELPGQLIAVEIDEGSPVTKGQVLARLDTSALAADRQVLITKRSVESSLLDRLQRGEREEVVAVARGEVKRMQVILRLKEADLKRAESVYEGRAISKSDYDDAVFAHEAAKVSLEQAQKRLEELETGSRIEDVQAQAARVAEIDAQLQRLRVQFEKSEIVAPFDAVCIRRMQDEGVTLTQGQIVVEISEVDQLEARFALPPQEVSELSSTKTIEVGGGNLAVGEFRVISQIDQLVRAVDVVIPINVTPGMAISVLPGQTCTINLSKCISADCIEMPITALVPSIRGLWSCYRIRPTDNDPDTFRVEKVEVTVLHTDGTSVYVSAALQNGDLIIPDGVHRVVPGMLVRAQSPS